MSALEKIGGLNLVNVVDVKAMFTQASNIFLVFPWAAGGNLLDFWSLHGDYPARCNIARHFLRDIFEQLQGLSYALAYLHDFKGNRKASYRHGDLKPENILVFRPQNISEYHPGTWKFSDLGLAKMHEKATGERYGLQATSIRSYGTISYMPPEAFSGLDHPTSRRFDIWSMGCIILQMITWLIYGMSHVEELERNTVVKGTHSCFWVEDPQAGRGSSETQVHGEVKKLIKKLKVDLKHSSPLLQLLVVVETELLVTHLRSSRRNGVHQYRADARGLHTSLQNICEQSKRDSSYWTSSWKAVKTGRGSHAANPRQAAVGIAQQARNVSSCLHECHFQTSLSFLHF